VPSALAQSAKTDNSPLYLQLAHQLEKDIRAGTYRVDQALPSERMLCESLGVSRITARKAIDILVARGLVLRRHGSGNFIAPRLEQPVSQLVSFSQQLRQRGYAPSSQWISRSVRAATAPEREALGLPRSARVAHLERLRLADGVPMAYEVSVLPVAVLPRPQALQDSLYAWLAAEGKAPVRGTQHIRASNADAGTAKLLQVAKGMALLEVTRTAFDATGLAVEFTQSYCRSDYYDFVAELH
jgi:GntR family transcriptional regulator